MNRGTILALSGQPSRWGGAWSDFCRPESNPGGAGDGSSAVSLTARPGELSMLPQSALPPDARFQIAPGARGGTSGGQSADQGAGRQRTRQEDEESILVDADAVAALLKTEVPTLEHRTQLVSADEPLARFLNHTFRI